MTVSYTIAECALGKILVATTPQGICRVELGDNQEALVSHLAAAFPSAEVRRDDSTLAEETTAVVALASGRAVRQKPRLDEHGTPFQLRVWEELRRIPFGETIPYGELAARIGMPTAVRAVAGACAANPIAVVTPCHRVVRADGGLGGYRWGIERKRALLAAEQERVRD